ncbi:hypothetical protein XENTR_v10021913 [Xenopus tropicalis]|nr:hypothetical protein XENTR_v10021913 [Xenopus tropicalis]
MPVPSDHFFPLTKWTAMLSIHPWKPTQLCCRSGQTSHVEEKISSLELQIVLKLFEICSGAPYTSRALKIFFLAHAIFSLASLSTL